MLFLAIILFTYSFIGLLKGGYFHDLKIKYGEEKIKYVKNELSKEDFDTTKIVYGIVLGLISVVLLALEILFLIMGMSSSNKLIVYSTTVFLVYMIISIVIGTTINKNKKELDLTIEEEANKYKTKIYIKRSVSGTINLLIQSLLYGFVIYELLFWYERIILNGGIIIWK